MADEIVNTSGPLLDGQVAIVTGSSSGIGRATAELFAAEGARVVVNSVRSVDEGRAFAAQLPDAIYAQADVADEAQVRTLVDAALDRWGRLDVVVNNAGAADLIDHRDLDAVTDDVWDRMLRVNLLGPWYLSRAAIEPMRAGGGGSIVNVSSLAGVHPTGSGSCIPYGVAKAGLNHLTMLLANAFGEDGIRVNAVAVGPIATPMWERGPAHVRELVKSRTVLGRAGRPEEIARACLLFAASGFATAQVLVVDGGMRFRVPR
jgi:ketoreductase RED2